MNRRYTAKGGPATFVSKEGDEIEIVSVTLRRRKDLEVGSSASVEQQTLEGKETPTPQQASPDPIVAVHEHYVAVMRPRRKVLDEQERAIIREALKVAGETRLLDEPKAIAECKQAIDGCALSDFHMGREAPSRYQGGRPKKYNKLSHILKGKRGLRTTREQIDYFIDIAEKGRRESSVTSERNATILQAKRVVLDAWEYPTDEHLQERRARAVAWLENNGFEVKTDTPTGEPVFVEVGS